MTCKNPVFSDSGIMISPKPGTKADPNFREGFFLSSIELKLSSIELSWSSIELKLSSIELSWWSIELKLSSIELSWSSIELKLSSIE